jgi:23S rRNA pseudouridine1911/1915/1917 synthase
LPGSRGIQTGAFPALYTPAVVLNDGYSYREVLGAKQTAGGTVTVLAHLARHYAHSSSDEWRRRLTAGEVRVDDRPVFGPEFLKPGQVLVWNRPPWQEPIVPVGYRVVYEDESLLAVDKPGGLPTLPGGGFLTQTLLHQVRLRYPGANPLHRLGRGTSGLVLFARTEEAASRLTGAWREHEVNKTYLALAAGVAERPRYEIDTRIGPVPHPRLGTVHAASPEGKVSFSVAEVLEQRPDSVLFSVNIHTGRPHQIRIHLASIGHPLVGDPLYARGGHPLPHLPGLPGDGGYLLHAARLEFTHPRSGERRTLETPAPEAFQIGTTTGSGLNRNTSSTTETEP